MSRTKKDKLYSVDEWDKKADEIIYPKDQKIGRPEKFPGLTEFVEKFIPSRLPMNWHHKLFYDMLENRIKMVDGKLDLNVFSARGEKKREKILDKVNKTILTLAPRFHSKSQCFTINYPLWEIYKNPNVRIIIVSANEDIAVSFNRAIMNQLENNQALIEKWGNLVPQFQDKKKWGERALIIKRDSLEKDPTITALGVGGKLISKRADIIICDDIIDIETARTKQARNKTREWFENVLIPILEDDGRLIVAGTAWYKGDIYDTLWTESHFDIRLKLKALMYDEDYIEKDGHTRFLPYELHEYPQALKAQDVMTDKVILRYNLRTALQGGTMWPNKWDFKKLIQKREDGMSASSFNRQYLNEPTSEEEKIFKDSHIKMALERGANKTILTEWSNTGDDRYGYGHLILAEGADLAISKKTTADKTAIAVWGLTENRDRVLLYIDSGRWSPEETKQRIIDVYYAFSPAKIKVENIAYQEMMRQAIGNEDIPVEGFTTTAGKKFNEETGIGHIAMLFEQGKVIIPSAKSNPEGYKKVMELLYELASYSYDQHAGDLLMASWFCLEALKEFDKKLRDNRGYFSTVALVEQLKRTVAPHKILLLGHNPPVYKFQVTSLVYIFRGVPHPELQKDKVFFEPNEPFMIFVTRAEKSVAYILQKQTSEIVGKIEGDITALMLVNLLERAGRFFNNAQIVVDRNGEGEAIYFELQNRFYPKLMCCQPDEHGHFSVGEGFKTTESNLPLSIDYFKQIVDSQSVDVRDEGLVREMGELISVEGNKLNLSFGSGQRIRTAATALWLLDNYETREKKLLTNPPKRKKKQMTPRYRVFNYKK